MATGGQVPTAAGTAKLCTDTNSVQIAVRGVTGTTYNNLDALATNCNSALIDSTHGTRNSTPTQLIQFRGYPRAEVNMNYEVVPVTVGFITKNDYVADAPFLNYSVGFPITVTLGITEKRSDTMATLSTHNETFTFNANSTTVNSSSTTLETGGFYILNDNKATSSYSVILTITYSASKTTYQTQTYPVTSPSLTYTDATPTYYTYTVYRFTSTPYNCSSTVNMSTAQTVYSNDNGLSTGSRLYTNTALTSELSPSGIYVQIPPESEGTKFDFFYYFGGASGGITSAITNCDA